MSVSLGSLYVLSFIHSLLLICANIPAVIFVSEKCRHLFRSCTVLAQSFFFLRPSSLRFHQLKSFLPCDLFRSFFRFKGLDTLSFGFLTYPRRFFLCFKDFEFLLTHPYLTLSFFFLSFKLAFFIFLCTLYYRLLCRDNLFALFRDI